MRDISSVCKNCSPSSHKWSQQHSPFR